METKKHFDNKVNEIMRDKEKAEKIVKNYWNSLVEIDTLSRKVAKLERLLDKNEREGGDGNSQEG